ncbi:MAG: hypothetical protein ACREEE_14490 [Dongiaceae bacterium]
MDKLLRAYRKAVREAIEEGWRAGLPAFQGRGGYLVALYPDGRQVKLKKLSGPLVDLNGGSEKTKSVDTRRPKRRR